MLRECGGVSDVGLRRGWGPQVRGRESPWEGSFGSPGVELGGEDTCS